MTREGAIKAWKTRRKAARASVYSERAKKAWRTIRARGHGCTPAKVEMVVGLAPVYTAMKVRRNEDEIRLEERHRMLGELLLIAKANKSYFTMGEAVSEYMQNELSRVNDELMRLLERD